jgi:hypothetical protein
MTAEEYRDAGLSILDAALKAFSVREERRAQAAAATAARAAWSARHARAVRRVRSLRWAVRLDSWATSPLPRPTRADALARWAVERSDDPLCRWVRGERI